MIRFFACLYCISGDPTEIYIDHTKEVNRSYHPKKYIGRQINLQTGGWEKWRKTENLPHTVHPVLQKGKKEIFCPLSYSMGKVLPYLGHLEVKPVLSVYTTLPFMSLHRPAIT